MADNASPADVPDPDPDEPTAEASDEPEVEGHMFFNIPLAGVKMVETIKPQQPKIKDIDFNSTSNPPGSSLGTRPD